MRTPSKWFVVFGMFLGFLSNGCSSTSPSVSDRDTAGDGGSDGSTPSGDANGMAGIEMGGRDGGPDDDGPGSGEGGGVGIGGGGAGATVDGGAMDAAGGLGGCLGACFDTLTAGCPKVIGCTEAVMGTETVICYSNGVKELRQFNSQAEDGTVKKPNGDLCYTWILVGPDQTFMNASGQAVAQLNGGPTSRLYTSICQPGQVAMDVDFSTPECAVIYAVAAQSCAVGTCTW